MAQLVCTPVDKACNSPVDVRGHLHHCGKRAGHDGAHVCICYWVWAGVGLLDEAGSNRVADDVLEERGRQDRKWGQQNHPDGTGPEVRWSVEPGPDQPLPADVLAAVFRDACQEAFAAGRGTWLDILLEEVAELATESEPAHLRAELIQVAAVASAWVEAIDRRLTPRKDES